MGSFLESCKNFCQPAQNRIEKWVPGTPSDMVWGLAKSSVYSFTVCVISTKGNVITGIKSVLMTVVVLTIYMFAKIFFEKLDEILFSRITSKKKKQQSFDIEAVLISFSIALVLGEKSKLPICAKETAWLSGVPLALASRKPHTPVIGVFPCW